MSNVCLTIRLYCWSEHVCLLHLQNVSSPIRTFIMIHSMTPPMQKKIGRNLYIPKRRLPGTRLNKYLTFLLLWNILIECCVPAAKHAAMSGGNTSTHGPLVVLYNRDSELRRYARFVSLSETKWAEFPLGSAGESRGGRLRNEKCAYPGNYLTRNIRLCKRVFNLSTHLIIQYSSSKIVYFNITSENWSCLSL